jgi:Predicted Zn-dependent protease (DUF2268)
MKSIALACVKILGFTASAYGLAAGDTRHAVEIDDRVPAFVRFYTHATAVPRDSTARWLLWRSEYGIAAVPPGPEGDAMARTLLESAWPRYPPLIVSLPLLESQAKSTAEDVFAKTNTLYATGAAPIRTKLVLYVGQFDNNAYTIPSMSGNPVTVMMPVEAEHVQLLLAHEIAHSISMQLAPIRNSFGGPVGETVFLEGLAMRTAQKTVPGLPDTAYTQMADDTDWLSRCLQSKRVVLAGIELDFDKADRASAVKYTFGAGNTGLRREAYCAGWILVGRLLETGWTLPELARIPEDKILTTIRQAAEAGSEAH